MPGDFDGLRIQGRRLEKQIFTKLGDLSALNIDAIRNAQSSMMGRAGSATSLANEAEAAQRSIEELLDKVRTRSVAAFPGRASLLSVPRFSYWTRRIVWTNASPACHRARKSKPFAPIRGTGRYTAITYMSSTGHASGLLCAIANPAERCVSGGFAGQHRTCRTVFR